MTNDSNNSKWPDVVETIAFLLFIAFIFWVLTR